jgi:kynurenine 3-monooxygenase
MSTASPRITLIGAGLNGPLLAIALARRGFSIDLYERRPDMRMGGARAGRSINLAVSARGIHALQQVGLWDSMRAIVTPMKGRMMHSLTGELTFQQYGKDDSEVIHSISRADLSMALLSAAESSGVNIHFNRRGVGYDSRNGTIRFRNEETGQVDEVTAEVTIGCDGSASAIRMDMSNLPRFNLSQQYLEYGYKELTIPAAGSARHAIEPHALHIWPRGAFMLIALPNLDGTFACILFLPFAGKPSFDSLMNREDVVSFFGNQFPDALKLMPGLADNFFENPIGSMVTVKCAPWHVEGKVLLLGDAAHAIVPFFGQGLNCGFEDCMKLVELIDLRGPDWLQVFAEFERARRPNTDAIADMAIENFAEMRDHVADPAFLLRKKVELALEARFSGVFVPKYAMVTFHRVPYSVALTRGAVQEKILSRLCAPIRCVEDLDWALADQLVQELTPLEQAP